MTIDYHWTKFVRVWREIYRWMRPPISDHETTEHSSICDRQTDPAFPCNCGPWLRGKRIL